jgi:broad specificity phosphatase PhoE
LRRCRPEVDELILARHGESEHSCRGTVNGDPEVRCGLTETGREQARALGAALAGRRIDLCATSEFERTRETADLALKGRSVPRLAMAGLNDIRMGAFEGGRLEDFRMWLRLNGPVAMPPGGGETRVQAILRFCRTFATLRRHPEGTILAVTHGLPAVIFPLAARGEPPPLTLEGTEATYAAPRSLSAAELSHAIGVLEAWARRVSVA